MIVRPAREADAADVAAIWNRAIDETAITFTTARKRADGLAADIALRGAAFQVAERGGQIIGFATFFPFRAGPGYAHTMEHSVLLDPTARGGGAGRALMHALEIEARARSVHSLWACISGENPDGVAFHAAIGFREIARLPEVGYKFGRWMDLVLMQKMLGLSH